MRVNPIRRWAQAGAATLALLPAIAAAQTVGVASAVVNDVKMTTNANRTLHKAVLKERVSLGNDILTGKASRAQLLLLDRTSFTVGPNARIKVDRFVYDPARRFSAVGVSVTKGAFRFVSGKPTHANPGQSGIRTPTASIGIRGTIVEVAVGEEAIRIAREQGGIEAAGADRATATLILLRGPGAGAQGGEQPGAIDVAWGSGKSLSLQGSGMALFFPREGADPFGPFPISNWGSAYLSGLLGTGAFSFDRTYELDFPANPLDGFQFNGLCSPGLDQAPPTQSPGGPNGPPITGGAGAGGCASVPDIDV